VYTVLYSNFSVLHSHVVTDVFSDSDSDSDYDADNVSVCILYM
jgi:hypothetical protein